MIKTILPLIALLLFLPISLADDFDISIEPIVNRIFKNEVASVNLTVTNNLEQEQEFRLSSDVLWNLMSYPLPDYYSGMRVDAESTRSTILKLDPPNRISVGPKLLEVVVESKLTGIKKKTPITIYIKSTGFEMQDYLPFIIITVLVDPVKIDPRGKFTVKIKLKNTNILNLDEVTIDLTTNSRLFHKKRIISLGPLEERTETFVMTLSPVTSPRKDVVIATISTGDTVFTPEKENIEIINYSSFVDTPITEEGFLKTKTRVVILNDGNTEGSELYKIETNRFRSLFTYTHPNAKFMQEDDKSYLVWEIVLGSSQKIEIRYTENYRTLFALGIIILLVIILYFMMRSPVIVSKRAEVMEIEEGGISKIKITLNIQNRTKTRTENVRVIEKIPNIANLVKEEYLGTLKPTKVLTHDVKGTLLKWNIDVLEGFEERMITYKIKSKLSILGALSLSPAVIKFKNRKGNIVIAHSNSSVLNI